MRRIVLALVGAVVVSSCGGFPFFVPPAATPAPFCAPFGELGSVHLDYTITPPATLTVAASEAERVARERMGATATVTTCSVRIARYDNLSEHYAAVWVVHLDGLSTSALGGPISFSSTPPSPRVLRRALVLMTIDAPTTPVFSIASGP